MSVPLSVDEWRYLRLLLASAEPDTPGVPRADPPELCGRMTKGGGPGTRVPCRRAKYHRGDCDAFPSLAGRMPIQPTMLALKLALSEARAVGAQHVSEGRK
jgi:hypothetical protein